mgnify:CR=1 FL=1
MNKTVIELQNIKRNFQVGDETVHALRGVSFNINEGEFVTIMGTSGSGKSTLLNTLGCLDTPTSGEYLLDGISVRTMSKPQRAVLRNRKIGFVFQKLQPPPQNNGSRKRGVAADVQLRRQCLRTSPAVLSSLYKRWDWATVSNISRTKCPADRCNVLPSPAHW